MLLKAAWLVAAASLLLVLVSVAGCGEGGEEPPAPEGPDVGAGDTAAVAAAGDISCDPSFDAYDPDIATEPCGQLATSDLMLEMDPDAVLALGDLQYPEGELENFREVYEPTWGRLIDVTHPVPGNHEYLTEGADGYFDYFEEAGGPTPGERDEGYYAFDVGAWRVLALNTNCEVAGGCDEGSPQHDWLREELEATDAECVLAFSHQPLFSSGEHGGITPLTPLWELLYEHGAEAVISGHDHIYERFAPQTPAGELDEERGIRQFVVGTGGGGTGEIVDVADNSEVRTAGLYGVLELQLAPDGYDWEFIPATGGELDPEAAEFSDSGSAKCFDPAPGA